MSRPQRRDFSDRILTQIDKDRRTAAQKARDAKVSSDARMATVAAIYRQPHADRIRYCEGVLDGLRDVLTAHADAALASSIIAAKATQPIIAMGAKGRAEQAFASLIKAANDGGDQ